MCDPSTVQKERSKARHSYSKPTTTIADLNIIQVEEDEVKITQRQEPIISNGSAAFQIQLPEVLEVLQMGQTGVSKPRTMRKAEADEACNCANHGQALVGKVEVLARKEGRRGDPPQRPIMASVGRGLKKACRARIPQIEPLQPAYAKTIVQLVNAFDIPRQGAPFVVSFA